MDILLKIIVVYSKTLNKSKKFRKKAATWHILQKKGMNGCAPWMKREALYTNRVVGGMTNYMG